MGAMFCKTFITPRLFRSTIVGPAGSGKSSLLYRIKDGFFNESIPITSGFNLEKVIIENDNAAFQFFDIGSSLPLKNTWNHYFFDCKLLILVVDSTNIKVLEETKEGLHQLIEEREILSEVDILILNNKIDLENGIQKEKLIEKLDLKSIQTNEWFVIDCSAKSGEGIDLILEKLCEFYKKSLRE